MMPEFIFNVAGTPAPGGSKTAIPIYKGGKLLMKNGRPILRYVDAGKGNKAWRKIVRAKAEYSFACQPWTCPIEVEFHFTMPRPKSHYGTGKNALILREDAPGMHAIRPDATKLVRSTEDACTGILWADDGQIVRQWVSKRYGAKPGVQIVMREAVAGVLCDHGQPGEELRQDDECVCAETSSRNCPIHQGSASPGAFGYNPAHELGTCSGCGEEMIYNVPRLGPDGGIVHKNTGTLLCAHDSDLATTGQMTPKKKGGDAKCVSENSALVQEQRRSASNGAAKSNPEPAPNFRIAKILGQDWVIAPDQDGVWSRIRVATAADIINLRRATAW